MKKENFNEILQNIANLSISIDFLKKVNYEYLDNDRSLLKFLLSKEIIKLKEIKEEQEIKDKKDLILNEEIKKMNQSLKKDIEYINPVDWSNNEFTEFNKDSFNIVLYKAKQLFDGTK